MGTTADPWQVSSHGRCNTLLHVLLPRYVKPLTDRYLTDGRYQPPCRKGVMNCLMFLSSAATKKLSAEIQHVVHKEGLDISISGTCLCPVDCLSVVFVLRGC